MQYIYAITYKSNKGKQNIEANVNIMLMDWRIHRVNRSSVSKLTYSFKTIFISMPAIVLQKYTAYYKTLQNGKNPIIV
jgi:hypothetical protein